MIYVFEVTLVNVETKVHLATKVECITANNANDAMNILRDNVIKGWEIDKATLIGSRAR